MKIFKTQIAKRIAIWKNIGLIAAILWLIAIPYVFTQVENMLMISLSLWYITLWAIVWVFGVWNEFPLFQIKIPYWIRWILVWAWMNFILVLLIYNDFITLFSGSIVEWWSPFWMVLEWAIFWLVVDYIATKYCWDGQELIRYTPITFYLN
jgi:hypothetical protein